MARGHHNNQLDKEQLANGELEYRFNFIPLRIDTRCYDKGVIEAINQISRYKKLMRNRKKITPSTARPAVFSMRIYLNISDLLPHHRDDNVLQKVQKKKVSICQP